MTNCTHPILPGHTWCPRCGDLLDGHPTGRDHTQRQAPPPSAPSWITLAFDGATALVKFALAGMALFLVLVVGYLLLASGALAATPTQLAVARAETFWSGPPPCGQPIVGDAEGPDYGGEEVSARAQYATCEVHLTASLWASEREQALNWPEFCLTMTHEVGHLELGPTYFASINPTNPAHSPNERSVMYAHMLLGGVHPSTCFPAAFTLPNGTRVKWTLKGKTILGVTRTRRARHWGLLESQSGGIGLAYPSEARLSATP